MAFILLKHYWYWGVFALLALVITIVSVGYNNRGHAIEAIKIKHELILATELAAHKERELQISKQNFQGVINAVNQSTERQKQMASRYADVVAINDSLSDSIKNIETSLITANRAAVIDYTKSIHRLLEDSRSQYLEMASAAAREQEEARRLREAWPKY